MITKPVISYFQALRSLVPDAKLYVEDNDWDRVNWSDEREQPSKAEVDAEVVRLQANSDAQAYARNRASEYPSQGDQMDMIYKDNKNSTTTHADAVEAVKTKWPKDNSGPV
jgi:hypothetical protein